ncbi:MAG: hypothetical protein V4546_04590 [Bacteroidota bacterium]
MNSFKIFSVAIILFIFSVKIVKADVGCALNYGDPSSEVIYFTVIGTAGTGSWTNYGSSPTYNNVGFPNACPRYEYSTALDAGGRCCINGNCNNTTRTRVNFTPIPCPIDDEIPYILLSIASVGLFYIKRKTPYLIA